MSYNKNQIEKECKNCKKKFIPKNNSNFCSTKCKITYIIVEILDFIFPRF